MFSLRSSKTAYDLNTICHQLYCKITLVDNISFIIEKSSDFICTHFTVIGLSYAADVYGRPPPVGDSVDHTQLFAN